MEETTIQTTEAITTAINTAVPAGLDVEMLNFFVYFATGILALAVLWWVCKWVYRLFNLFF